MKTLLNPTLELLERDLEVKSYIYQQIVEFEPYVTPTTIVEVVAKDPMALKPRLNETQIDVKDEEIRNMFRIAIILRENGTELFSEAVDTSIFEAIRKAKEILLKKLIVIQDQIISAQDRLSEINQYLQNNSKH